MSAEGKTKEFPLLTDVRGLGDQNHPEARSKSGRVVIVSISE
jgi:hypothetical protein